MALGTRAADVFRIVFTSTGVNLGTGHVAGIVLSIALDKIATK